MIDYTSASNKLWVKTSRNATEEILQLVNMLEIRTSWNAVIRKQSDLINDFFHILTSYILTVIRLVKFRTCDCDKIN